MTAAPPPGLPPGPRLRPRRILGLASILIDRTVRVAALPPRGGDAVGRPAGTAPGGGINTLVAARRLGLAAGYAAPHGVGDAGDAVRRALATDGIATVLPPDVRGDTGWCLALLEPDGERTFVTVPGVEAEQTAATLRQVTALPGDAVYASGYDLLYPGSGPHLAAWLAALTRTDGGPWVVLDPGPLVAAIPPDRLSSVLARVDLVSLSRAELDALGGDRALAARLDADAVVLRREGADGATLLLPASGARHCPAARPPGPVIDTNGAGDTFTGALLAALSAGIGWAQALEVASCAAACCLTRSGAATGPDVATLLAEFPHLAGVVPPRG